MTYWSGVVDDTDLCYLGGTPHGLLDVLGIRMEEIDGLYDFEENEGIPVPGNELGLEKKYQAKHLCELVELRGAHVLMTYGKRFLCGKTDIDTEFLWERNCLLRCRGYGNSVL